MVVNIFVAPHVIKLCSQEAQFASRIYSSIIIPQNLVMCNRQQTYKVL